MWASFYNEILEEIRDDGNQPSESELLEDN